MYTLPCIIYAFSVDILGNSIVLALVLMLLCPTLSPVPEFFDVLFTPSTGFVCFHVIQVTGNTPQKQMAGQKRKAESAEAPKGRSKKRTA